MPFFHQVANMAARRMPRVINPTAHAVLDYTLAAGFLVMAAKFWKSRRRAALGSLFCGSAAITNSLLTRYPGGAFDVIDYKTHGRIDAALAAMTASTPQFMGFSDEPEARFFSMQAISRTLLTGMSDFNHYSDSPEGHPLKAAS